MGSLGIVSGLVRLRLFGLVLCVRDRIRKRRPHRGGRACD
jgi:hypothetical protein